MMGRIIEYKIIKGTPEYVEEGVNSAISFGWQPHGSLFRWSNFLFQAMVKYEPPGPVIVEESESIFAENGEENG